MTRTRVMGIDASTSTIGISIVSYDNNDIILEHTEFYKPPKKGNIFERLLKVRNFLIDRINNLKPDKIVLEDIILFMKGKSRAQTITILSVFNRIIGMTILEKTGTPPYLYNVHFIRKIIKKSDKRLKKEDIPDLIANIFNITFPYIKNRRGNIAEESFDVADSIAAALCYIIIEQNNLDHKQDIKKKRKRRK